jgi:hypothetical protein
MVKTDGCMPVTFLPKTTILSRKFNFQNLRLNMTRP